jgi:uncharacterized protein YbaR (Trm112 family)
VRVPAGERDRLEHLCRYALRPPVAQDRLRLTPEGQVLLELRHPWSDGTTHLVFDPVELLERLAVLIPRPRINLILYHGVLGPRAAWRPLVVGFGNPADATTAAASTTEASVDRGEPGPAEPDPSDSCERRPPRGGARLWADLMRRSFGLDVLACPRCGGRLRLIALIDEAAVIARILRHLRLPTEVPTPRPGRAPSLDAARDALSEVEGRRSSRLATSKRTPAFRTSFRATDRCPQGPTRRRCARPSSGSPPVWTSCLIRRSKRR